MTKYRLYNYECADCGREEKDVMLDVDTEDPDAYNCPDCGDPMTRLFQAPMVLQASYPDGHKRPGFAAEKEANKLRMASYDMPPEDRGKIHAAIEERKVKSD